VQRLVSTGLNDKEFLTQLRNRYKKKLAPRDAAVQVSLTRSDYRIKDIRHHLEKWQDHKDLQYLDVGCSEGKITASVAEYLKLSKERAYGVDVDKQPPSDAFTFVSYNGRELPFKDGTFALATVFMAAHHFEHFQETFASLRRVLRGVAPPLTPATTAEGVEGSAQGCGVGPPLTPATTAEGVKGSAQGSLLIVREHDVQDDATRAFLDLVHAVYMTVVGEEMTPEQFAQRYVRGQFATYRRIQDWVTVISTFGFQLESTALTHDLFDSAYLTFGVTDTSETTKA
jgi:SAM-dependent methyltransferase